MTKESQNNKTKQKKSSILRWKLILPIILIATLLCGATFLFFDDIASKSVIKLGEKIFDAKVEIAKTTINWKPFGIAFTKLQVANKEKPMQNLFEIDDIRFDLHFSKLLQKKVLIEKVGVQNISFQTKRITSGALVKKEKKKTKKKRKEKTFVKKQMEKIKIPAPKIDLGEISFENMNFSELIDVNNLGSVKAANKIQKDIEAKQKYWEDFMKNQTFATQIDEVKKEADSLSKLNIKGIEDIKKIQKGIKSIDKIKTNVESLQKNISNTQKKFNADYAYLKNSIDNITKMGANDYNNLLKTLPTQQLDAANIGKALFGAQVAEKIEKVLHYVELVKKYTPKKEKKIKKPKITRAKGITIKFPSKKEPIPSFWIKEVALSGKGINNEQISGTVTNITTEQDITQKPLHVDIYAKNVIKGHSTFKLKAKRDQYSKNGKDSIALTIDNYPLDSKILYQANNKEIGLKSGKAKIKVAVDFIQKELNGKINIACKSLVFHSPNIDKNSFTLEGILYDVLLGTDRINIYSKLSGKLLQPNFSLSTDLDKKLSKQFDRVVQKKINQAKKTLQSEIDKQVNKLQEDALKSLGITKDMVGGDIGKLLTDSNALNTLLDKEKKKYENQVNAEVNKHKKAAEAKLNAEKKKAEKKVQNELEKQMKKFKFKF